MQKIVHLSAKLRDYRIAYEPDAYLPLNYIEVEEVYGEDAVPECVTLRFENGSCIDIDSDTFINMIHGMLMERDASGYPINKIGAIKLVRNVLNWGLRDAKEFVEKLYL